MEQRHLTRKPPLVVRRVTARDEEAAFDRGTVQPLQVFPSRQALDLLASILGGSSTARIYRKLIAEDEIATSAGAWFQGASRGPTRFSLYGTPRGSHSVEDVEQAIAAVMEDVIENGVTQEELDRQRNALLKSVIFERDSQTTLARLYGVVLSLDGTLEDVHGWPERIREVTVEDINRVARKYLRPQRSVTSYLRPAS